MDFKSILLAAFLGGGVGAASIYFALENKNEAPQVPSIAVVDFAKMAMQYPDGATPEQVEDMMSRTKIAIDKLKDAGYIVLDSGAVVAAPEDSYLPEDLF
ncbi:hypothetical protein [Marinomonas algarum]|uniref:Conjugative transfer protein 345 n=1 Tax=Marinomonas algarum TaxID=2883105 RepID=A0A9X1IQI2_9GAMM|nr:hypothetical protein [Marinomonas algarum]MCB5162651.1 hypothetical protein [Marinomonas algarum]